MTNRSASLQGNRGITAALLVAAIILAVAFVQRLLSTIFSFFVLMGQFGGQNEAVSVFSGFLVETVLGLLPFAIGVFLCIWLVKPVVGELRVAGVIWRSLLAAVAGAVVVFVATIAGSLFTGFDTSAGLVYGWAAGAATTAAGNVGWAISGAIYSAGSIAISLAPLTVLAGTLVWFWLRGTPVAAVAVSDTVEV